MVPVAEAFAPIVSCTSGSGEGFSGGLLLGELVGALALNFFELLDGGGFGDYGLAVGNEKVATVAVLYCNHVVFVAEAVDVFFQYDFHFLKVLK